MRKLLTLLWLALSIAGAHAQSISPPGGSGGITAGTTTVTGCTSLNLFYNNAGVMGCMTGTSWDDTNRALTITGATLTGVSHPILELSQIWNNGTTAFTGIKLNVTDTASSAASLLMDLQVGGASKFSVRKDGLISALNYIDSNATVNLAFASLTMSNAGKLIWGSGSTAFNGVNDLFVTRRAAASLQLGTTDAAAPVAQTIGVQSVVAGTSNTAGALWTINGSRGTGTGVGGNIKMQVALADGSGTAQNALVSALEIDASAAVPRIAAGGPIKRKGYTVATLPTGSEGDEAYVTDQLTACPVLGGTFTGGGTVKCTAFFDGASWTHQ